LLNLLRFARALSFSSDRQELTNLANPVILT
jgi:hypothetical protein